MTIRTADWRRCITPFILALGLVGIGAIRIAHAAQNGFAMQRWTGAWGSDGPIFTGDLNGDGKTDVFMWRDSDKSWTVNLSTGSGVNLVVPSK
jgi:hypothetical protein